MSNYQSDGLHQGQALNRSDGLRFRVAAYIQSADGEHPDHITFDMSGTDKSSAATVFGVFKGMSPDADRHDMRLWDFYVADSEYAMQLSHGGILTLPVLESSSAIKCGIDDLGEAICRAVSD